MSDFNTPEFDEEEFDQDGLISFEELKSICERHIENGHEPYTEDEFKQIAQWAEETVMNESILRLVLDGTLDVIFDEEKLNEIGQDGLLFSLSENAKNMLDTEIDLPEDGFLNLDFDEEK